MSTDSERRAARWARMQALLNLRPYIGTPCPYCGARMTPAPVEAAVRQVTEISRDHFIPKCRGGADAAHNLLAVCRTCNDLKGDLLPTEWLAALQQDGDPRAKRLAVIFERLPGLRRRCEAVEARESAEARACR